MVVSISAAKAALSSLLERVRAGETITITDRGIPVAQLAPLPETSDVAQDSRLARLERQGLVRRPRQTLDIDALLGLPLPRFEQSVLAELLEERHASDR